MKSARPWAAVTKISWAPTPFISGIGEVRQLIVRAVVARLELALRRATPSRSVSIVAERFRQQPAAGFGGVQPAIVVGVERGEQPRRRGRGVDLQTAARMRVAG